MNTSRFFAAAGCVWIVRVILNATFYTQVVGGQLAQISEAHPGIVREVIPAYVVADLIFAVVFAFLFVKVGAALGGGLKGGVMLGVLVAILSPVIGILYQHFSVTYLPAGLAVTEAIFQVVAHAVEGAVAGLLYKT